MNTDVIVSISGGQNEVSEIEYGLILIISNELVKAYTEYDLTNGIANSGIATDYPTSTETYKKALAIASQKPSPKKVAVIGCSTTEIDAEDVITILDAMLVEHDSFFRILTTYATDATKLAIAQWAVTNFKSPYLQYSDITFTSDYSAVNARVHLHKTANEFADAVEAGYFASLIPGTTIPKFRQYIGLTPQTFTAAEKTFIDTNNLATYEKFVGKDMQRSSRATSWTSAEPLYIDELEARIYIKTEMANNLLTAMESSSKLPSDFRGIQIINAKMLETLEDAKSINIIALKDDGNGSYSTDISNAAFDKVLREWAGVNFEYEYLHGTEKIAISGVVK